MTDSVTDAFDPEDCAVQIAQDFFRGYGNDAEDRANLVRNLRRMADWIEAGGRRPENVVLALPTGYRIG